MKKQILRTLSLMIALFMLTAMVTAQAEDKKNDGYLSIVIGSDSSAYNREGIVLDAYLVAEGNYGDWKEQKIYDGIQVFTTDKKDTGASWLKDSMRKIDARIHNGGIKPTQQAKTDVNGKADFSNLPRGIYYIEMSKGPDFLKLESMLLSVPDTRGSLQIRTNAKGSYNPPTKVLQNVKKGNREHFETIDEYETALGLGNIQMHVGVCYE